MTKEQINERDSMIYGEPYNPSCYMGGMRRFDRISLGVAKQLIADGFLDPDDRQNNSPSAQEMIDFCDDGNPGWYFHGYTISPDRLDCRVTLEGVGYDGSLTAEDAIAFGKFFRLADELEYSEDGPAYCWYD